MNSGQPATGTTTSIVGLHDDEVLAQLRSGENATVLSANFGDAEYRELRRLARAVSARRVRGGPRVLILPGIMGSKIGTPGRLRDDVLWLDPVEVMAGNLLKLALPQGRQLQPVGVMLFGYLKLKLNLQLAGFDAAFHAYDWRLGLDHLGKELGDRIARERSKSVHLVAHSMGGLVARAAMNSGSGDRIKQLIELGTPNYGSFAPVQALRATYPTVRKIAALDLHHSAEQLAEKVFRTFPGLYQMLPSPERHEAIDFFKPRSWPKDVLAPDARMLDEARRVRAALAPADERCCLIVGVNQETVTSARREKESFEYTVTLDGDGTVPRALAQWPKARTWFAEETHGGLANSAIVGASVIDLLKTNDTTRLPASVSRKRRVVVGRIRDSTLRQSMTGKIRWTELSLDARRKFLEPVISAEFHGQSAQAAASKAPQPRLLDSQHRRRTLEIRLACGSITEVQSAAIVLGVFRGVEPRGAAAAIDRRLEGAVKEFTLRRMFSGNRGEVFVLPTGRSPLSAEMVLLAGLGDFDRFDADAQQFVAQNIVRTFVRTHIDEFATVLLGAGSGVSIDAALANQIGGYFSGLKESDQERRLRRITLVEYDRSKCNAIRQALFKLSTTPLFDDIEVSFDEVQLPTVTDPVSVLTKRGRQRAEQRLAYLIVSQEGAASRSLSLRASVLTSGSKAAVLTGTKIVPRRQLTEHLQRIALSGFTARRLSGYGEVLGALLLHRDVLAALDTVKAQHLVVVHDSAAAAYPWETLCVNGRFPAADAGLSRRYAAENLSVARWREARRRDATLDVLLVVDPTNDLDGAAAEGDRLRALLQQEKNVRIVELRGQQASRERLLDEFRSGRYDVLHYAGHAFFDPEQPGRSGIVCADQKVLSGTDLTNVTELPALAFFNACEAGRIRSGTRFSGHPQEHLRRNVSLAEGFLRGGVANYVGTYWPVGDAEAEMFSLTFYKGLVLGESVGNALKAARTAVRKLGSVDWADYIHYGSVDFMIKQNVVA